MKVIWKQVLKPLQSQEGKMMSVPVINFTPKNLTGIISHKEWLSLPLELRRRWWLETDWSRNPPSSALVVDVYKHLVNRNPPEPSKGDTDQ